MRALYRESPRRRRTQLGGAVALCALATGSTGALLIVANAGVDLVRITPVGPGAAVPTRADRLPAGQAGSVTPSREPAFGWSEREARRPYVSPRSPSPAHTRYEPPAPDESGAVSPEAVPASPGEGSERSGDAVPDSAGSSEPAVGVVSVRPEWVESPTPSASPSVAPSESVTPTPTPSASPSPSVSPSGSVPPSGVGPPAGSGSPSASGEPAR